MNFKRVLTMLLALCLIVNMAVPGVSALTAGQNEYVAGQNPTASEKTGEPINITPLRDAVQAQPAVKAEGEWVAEQTQVPNVDLLNAELPQGVKELREAAELYAADEVVPAFIVLEDKPLAESGVAIADVSARQEKAMLAQQNKLISSISKKVLKAELDVRYQFTYLSNAISANVPFGKLAEIAELPGVKTVFLMPVYDKCETVNTASAADMIGVPSIWEDLGYTGEGMKIAIVDTGTDTDHQSLNNGAYLYALSENAKQKGMTLAEYKASLNLMDAESIAKVLPMLNVSKRIPGSLIAVLVGIAMAILFSYNASSGGLDIVAKIMSKYLKMGLGTAVSVSGIAVALTSAFYCNGDYKIVVISVLGTYFSGLLVDKFIFGLNIKRRVCIISSKLDEIVDYILHDLHSGATLYESIGAYDKVVRREAVVIVDKNEYRLLMDHIKKTDPKAFVTVIAVNELNYQPKNIGERSKKINKK